MKRSEIDKLIDQAIEFFYKKKFKLPHWAYWTRAEWERHLGEESKEIRNHGMGWNLTDFGSGEFDKTGLLLFIIRNGRLLKSKPATTKIYAEKVMMVRPGQVTPWHFHWMKTEDLINRGGGRLEVELGWSTDDEAGIDSRDVLVQLDGITKRIPAGGKILLEPGQSVTLPPKLCHQFSGHTRDRSVCVGEVSSLNDDSTDNCFPFGISKTPIDEDESPKYWLCTEYPRA